MYFQSFIWTKIKIISKFPSSKSHNTKAYKYLQKVNSLLLVLIKRLKAQCEHFRRLLMLLKWVFSMGLVRVAVLLLACWIYGRHIKFYSIVSSIKKYLELLIVCKWWLLPTDINKTRWARVSHLDFTSID